MKVLHTLEAFLPISENWAYPQVTGVSGVEPAVLCRERLHPDLFPLPPGSVFRDPPPWDMALGIPRLLNSIAFRLGNPQLVAGGAAQRWKPDLIHAHFGMKGWETLNLRRRLQVPMVTSFYGVDAWMLPQKSALWRERYRELFAQGDLFLAEGPAMRERLIAIGCPPEKARVMRLGVDIQGLAFRERDFTPPLEVVMMARFVEKKGFPDGLRAFAEAVRQGADLRMTIVGDSTDESGAAIKAEMHKIVANTPGLADRVKFPGFLKPEQANDCLRKAHVFLCPSKHSADGDAEGGSPLSLTQAMALGLVCVGTRHCDIPEVISDGETGFLCESGDVAALADLLVKVAANPGVLPQICRLGRESIEQKFSISEMTGALGRIYQAISSGFCERSG